jgi:dihydroxyacetone kinase-like protein
MKSISQSDIEHAVHTVADTVITNENYFSELDGTCGDGDFGTSLATGFRFVLSKWDSLDRSSIGTFLSGIGVTITSNVGGCSGPLWGTGFIRTGDFLIVFSFPESSGPSNPPNEKVRQRSCQLRP